MWRSYFLHLSIKNILRFLSRYIQQQKIANTKNQRNVLTSFSVARCHLPAVKVAHRTDPTAGNKMFPLGEEKKMKGMWTKRWAPKQVWRFWELSLMKLDDIHSSGILKSWMDLNPSRILQKAPLELVMSLEVLRYTHRVRMFHDVSFRHIKIYKEVLSIKKKMYSIHKPQKRTNRAKLTWSQMNNMHQLAPFWNPWFPKAADSRRRVAPAKSPHLPFSKASS